MSTTTADQSLRWIAARDRAITEHVAVYQVESTGQWVATSGTKPGVAYALEVTGNVVATLRLPGRRARQYLCKHQAAFYALIGAIPTTVDALEAEDIARDAAATIAPRPCSWCSGRGHSFNDYWLEVRPCSWCEGTGSGTAVVA
jgi:hypothetical protein